MENKRKLILMIIFITAIVIFAIVGTLYEKNQPTRNFLDKYIFLKEKHENNLPKIEINNIKDVSSFAFKNSIYVLRENELKIFNQNGNEEGSIEVSISNPIFVANGDFLCIAEKGGKNLYSIANKNMLWKKELESDIADIAINSNGYIAVSLVGTTYKTVIKTFDSKGTELFTTFLSSTYVIDMDISPDNKYLAIAEANFSGILLQSNIKIMSIDKAKNGDKDYMVYSNACESGDLIVKIKYQNKNELRCIFDNHIDIIKNGEQTAISDFEKQNILFVDMNNKIIKIFKEDSKTYLQVLNNVSIEKSFEVEEPKAVSVYGNIIGLNLGSEILFYNNSGWLIKRYYATQEVNKIILSDNIAGIVYNNKIEIISL